MHMRIYNNSNIAWSPNVLTPISFCNGNNSTSYELCYHGCQDLIYDALQRYRSLQ